MLTKAYLTTKRYMETHANFPQLTLLIRRETGFTNIALIYTHNSLQNLNCMEEEKVCYYFSQVASELS
jgi:hypothetical protein